MSPWLIVLVGLIYAYIAVEQGMRGNVPSAIIFSGYSFSNAGLWMMATGLSFADLVALAKPW